MMSHFTNGALGPRQPAMEFAGDHQMTQDHTGHEEGNVKLIVA